MADSPRRTRSVAAVDPAAASTEPIGPTLLRSWLRRLRLRLPAREALARRPRDAGRFAAAVSATLEAIRPEPLQESAHHTRIAVHPAGNEPAEAHRRYRALHGILGRARGVEPPAHLRGLVGSST